MATQLYEYHVKPVSISPDEFRNEQFALNAMLNDYAAEGWVLKSTLHVDSSSFLFVFSRSIDSSTDD